MVIVSSLLTYQFGGAMLKRQRVRTLFYAFILIAHVMLIFFFNKPDMVPLLIVPVLLEMLIYSVFGLEKQKTIHREKLMASNISDIDSMDGYSFEEYLKKLFTTLDFRVIKTPSSGDYGADLIVEKLGTKIAIQAKRYTGNVGLKAVQEVNSAMLYYETDQAWVVTNSGYTKSAIELAKKSKVTLIDRTGLINLIIEAKEIKEENTYQTN